MKNYIFIAENTTSYLVYEPISSKEIGYTDSKYEYVYHATFKTAEAADTYCTRMSKEK